MRYRRLLHDDERLVLDVRRHIVGCSFEIFMAVVVVAGFLYGYVAWPSAPHLVRLVFLYGSPAIAALTAMRLALYRSHHLILTSERLIVRGGVFHRVRVDLRISRLTSVTSHQRLRERMIAKGTLEIAVADSKEPLLLHEVNHPLRIARAISAAIDSLPGESAPMVLSRRSTASELLSRLERLHQRGAITDDEFAERSAGLSP